MGYVSNAIRQPRSMSDAEQRRVLKVSGEHRSGFRDHVLLSFALGTALREGEIAALNVGDVARGPTEIRSRIQLKEFARKGQQKPDGKASAVRQRVFVPKLVRAKLQKFLAWKKREGEPVGRDAPLFWARSGGGLDARAVDGARMSKRTIRHAWRMWQIRAGFEKPFYTFHELRHTGLTNLYKATKDIRLVQEQARHASVLTTQMYSHLTEDEIRRAVDDMPG
jgi:integrase/recombinase XerC